MQNEALCGNSGGARSEDNWVRVAKIKVCENKIPTDNIIAALSHYGEILSDIVEDIFKVDEDSEGTNVTGIYWVNMRLETHIPSR